MEDILKIIYICNKNRKILSKHDIKRICEIIIKEKKYDSYVNKINFKSHEELDSVATYDGNELCFYKDGLELLKSITVSDANLNGSKIDLINYKILSTIFHEFAHVRQHIITNSYTDESRIYRICEKLYHIDNFYEDNYSIMLNEVNAFALGNLNAYKIYKNLPRGIITVNDINFYKRDVLNTVLSSYEVDLDKEKVKSPSEQLLNVLKKYDCIKIYDELKKIIEGSKNYNLYNRLLVGLPISFKNYAYVNMFATNFNNDDYKFIKKLQKKK